MLLSAGNNKFPPQMTGKALIFNRNLRKYSKFNPIMATFYNKIANKTSEKC